MAASVVLLGAVLFVGGTLPSAQTQPEAISSAARALNLGRFEDVDSLLRGMTDPGAVVLLARADIARGRYANAEKRLAPLAASLPGSDAALEFGLLQLRLGRRPEGTGTLERLVSSIDADSAVEFLRLGLAARALGAFQDANGYFRQANRLAPNDPLVQIAWGELFLEKYDRAEAMKSFQAALKLDEDNVAARVGFAQAIQQENPQAAREAIERALKTNPNYVPAHLMAAELALDDRRRDDARAAIQLARTVNPNSLEALSLESAIAFLEGRTADFEARAREALAINPLYGEVYRVAGDHAARNYRFDEAVTLVRRALATDASNVRAYGDLGLHLLRTGDEAEARKALERAFKDDPFDAVTYNLLALLDSLDKFETMTDGDIVMRLHPDEAAVMREQALPLAKEAIATLSKLYGFTPRGPILIEMFPKHDDFAVRTLGLPGMIGALGACFGRVVTLDSPRARPPGQFNWQATLWHEIAHVITLQMSNNRLPRWLSEGISNWEERRARPEWGREMEVTFAQALNEGDKLLKLDSLNEGFSDPTLISLTYHQASLVAEHLVDTYGEPKLHQLLRAYGRGLETEEAMKEVYGIGLAQLQASFDARVEKQYAGLRAALKRPQIAPGTSLDDLKKLAADNPGSFAVQMRLAQSLREAKDPAGAIAALERAATMLPGATGDNNPNAMIAAIALEQGDNARAIRALDDLTRVNHADVESARKLAALVAPLGNAARSRDVYARVVAIDPFDSQAQSALGRAALQGKDVQSAIKAFRSALAANPPDRAAAHADLAEAYLAAGQFAEAKREALAALEIAPSFERAQDVLLEIVEKSGGA